MLTKSPVLSGAAPYLGGKRRLSGQIADIVASVPHALYAEPFVGMGGVFFRRYMVPGHEVINDISGEVVNFFRVVQRHAPEMLRVLRLSFSSRALFVQALETPPASLTDVERAARFYYLQKNCFGGKVSGRNFGVDPKRSRFNIRQLKRHVLALHQRLAGVVIEQLGYGAFIERYDAPDTLFYLDPPYWGCETDYGRGVFSRQDFTALAEQLAHIDGVFLLSLNDVPQVREVFSAFRIREVSTQYTIGSGKPKKVGEVLITNRCW